MRTKREVLTHANQILSNSGHPFVHQHEGDDVHRWSAPVGTVRIRFLAEAGGTARTDLSGQPNENQHGDRRFYEELKALRGELVVA